MSESDLPKTLYVVDGFENEAYENLEDAMYGRDINVVVGTYTLNEIGTYRKSVERVDK